jgi:hypothetical protein
MNVRLLLRHGAPPAWRSAAADVSLKDWMVGETAAHDGEPRRDGVVATHNSA